MQFVQRLLGHGAARPLEGQESNETPGLESGPDLRHIDLEDVFGGSSWMRFPFGFHLPGDSELP